MIREEGVAGRSTTGITHQCYYETSDFLLQGGGGPPAVHCSRSIPNSNIYAYLHLGLYSPE